MHPMVTTVRPMHPMVTTARPMHPMVTTARPMHPMVTTARPMHPMVTANPTALPNLSLHSKRGSSLDPPRQINRFACKLMISLREEKRTSKRHKNNRSDKTIDLDTFHTTNTPPKQSWIQNDLISLYKSDKDTIESGEWLTDTIIDAGQKVLAAQFYARFGEAGFQSIALGATFAFEIESDEFVQILHNGHNHWLTVSSVGSTPSQVLVYDSLYASAGVATKQQIPCLRMVTEPNLVIAFADVQMQAGGSDCGVFAMAFATAICFGQSPGKFHFDQQRMRDHLVACLEKQEFSMFPIRKERRQGRKVKSSETVALHCVCRMPAIK